MTEAIKDGFEKANLPLSIENTPISANNPDIFQITIGSKKSSSKELQEYFRVYIGENTDVRIVDPNPNHQQLILLVKEPENSHHKVPYRILKKYLCGFDEMHLFITELPDDVGAITSIESAHRILKPDIISQKEKETNRIKRQGEFFFTPITLREEKILTKREFIIEKKKPIDKSGVGNPHTADKIIRIHFNQQDFVFVSGKIKHPEHSTIDLGGWWRVSRNTEVRDDALNLTKMRDDQHGIRNLAYALFIPAKKRDLYMIQKNLNAVKKKMPIGTGGWRNAFIARKVISVNNNTFVKGKITHPQFGKVYLNTWSYVERDPNYVPPKPPEPVRSFFLD